MKLTFLTREGCGLCDEALTEMRAWLESREQVGADVEVEMVDIESDEALHRRFLERIPVIMVGDLVVSDFQFEREALEQALNDI